MEKVSFDEVDQQSRATTKIAGNKHVEIPSSLIGSLKQPGELVRAGGDDVNPAEVVNVRSKLAEPPAAVQSEGVKSPQNDKEEKLNNDLKYIETGIKECNIFINEEAVDYKSDVIVNISFGDKKAEEAKQQKKAINAKKDGSRFTSAAQSTDVA